MPKQWTDDEVSEEIKNAVAIVREDRFEAFVRGMQGKTNSDPNSGNDQSGNAGNGDGNNSAETKKKKSLWWGDSAE